MASATALYTPQVLALAAALAAYPPNPDFPLHGTARSPACGSTLTLDLDTAGGRITRIGIGAHACAIGQAAAAIFARQAAGLNEDAIALTAGAIEAWLKDGADMPAWPGLEAIAAARSFPGRHGAMLLPWKAALAALSSADKPG